MKEVGTAGVGMTLLPLLEPHLIGEVERAAASIRHLDPVSAAGEEEFWALVRSMFRQSGEFINLENGYFSPAPSSVLAAQVTHARRINENSSFYMRRLRDTERAAVRKELAVLAGCGEDELAVVRNTTEAIDTVINGIDWRPGDEVVISDQDYGSMVAAFEQRHKRAGILIRRAAVPLHPSSDGEIVGAYEREITPRTRLVHVTHLINLTGQILPVRAIADMAHAHGAAVLVDGAHAFAHIDFAIPDLHCDFFGASLHKWLCAALGSGILYMKKERIPAVWPLFDGSEHPATDIRKFEHTGTNPCHTYLAVTEAIRFHIAVGPARKEARLRYLKNYWTRKVNDTPGITVLTPGEDSRSCAIATVAIEGMNPTEVAEKLYNDYRIFTVAIETPAVRGVRITPHLYTSLQELDQLISALREITGGR